MAGRLKIENFGPVSKLDITVKPFTLFIGEQGVGKSTVVKVYSMFRWLEKALRQDTITIPYLTSYHRFRKTYCKYHRIDGFFSPDTKIEFIGNTYCFRYANGHLTVRMLKNDYYDIPKIMYVPAERSILSMMDSSVRGLRNLPDSLSTFSEEYENAKKKLSKGYSLPYEHFRFSYDKLNGVSWIEGDSHKSRLADSASGLQSSVPLCLVSEYLSMMVREGAERSLNLDEINRIRKKVAEIVSAEMSDSIKKALLENLTGYIRYSCFINIVEELELSLFPESQVSVLRLLIEQLNRQDKNELLLTTHSPYLLTAVNLSIMAAKVAALGEEQRNAVLQQIPQEWHLPSDKVAVFMLSHNCNNSYCVAAISPDTGMIDANFLDSASAMMGDEFQQLYSLYIDSL